MSVKRGRSRGFDAPKPRFRSVTREKLHGNFNNTVSIVGTGLLLSKASLRMSL